MEKKTSRWLGGLSVVVVVIVAVGFLGALAVGRHNSMMGYGMMGGWFGSQGSGAGSSPTPLSNDTAAGIARLYLGRFEGPSLELAELMVFDNHFYAEAREVESGRYAFEFLIDRFSGQVTPEPGPNMMWNQSYGHMMVARGAPGTSADEAMPTSSSDAVNRAQAFLDSYAPGLQVEEHAAAFPGYYTIDTLRNGEIVGMLSVNGYTGTVWVHGWHGIYLGEAMDTGE